MIISTTDRLEGREIQKYLGLVSGTDIYIVGGLIGGGLSNQENLYGMALKTAMGRMEEKAKSLGANAIVGVSTNFTSPGGLNYMIVVVTGTAVVAELKEADMPKPPITASSAPQTQTYGPGRMGSTPAAGGGWTCSCGRTNAGYVSSCVCGKSKYD